MVSQSPKKRKTQERALGFLLFSFLFSNAPTVYASADSQNAPAVNTPGTNQRQDWTEASTWWNSVEKGDNTEPAKLVAPPVVAQTAPTASDPSSALKSSTSSSSATESSAFKSSTNCSTVIGSTVIGSKSGSTAIEPTNDSYVSAISGSRTTAKASAANAKEVVSASAANPDSDLPASLAQNVTGHSVPLEQAVPAYGSDLAQAAPANSKTFAEAVHAISTTFAEAIPAISTTLAQAVPANSTTLAEAVPANGVSLAQAPPVVNGRIEPSTADPTIASNRIEELTKQAMLKIIELERFNLNYKANAAKQGRWKGWRYATFAEINNSLGLTGGIISIHNRGSHLHSSSKVKTYIQEDANIFPMVGSIIGASAAAMEFGINEYHEYQAFRAGYSPGRARAKVASLRADIDKLLGERDALVAVEKSSNMETGAEIDTLEGRVLHDLRDQSLLEFQRYHLGARRLMAFQQSQYFFDFAKNVTNAIGFDFAYLSLHRHRRVWNGRAGTLFDVSGALTMGGPIVSRAFGKLAGEYHKHYIKDSIGEAEAKECAILAKDQQELEAYCHSNRAGMDVVGKIVDRSATYGDQSKIFQDEIQSASKQLDKAKLVATQNIGAGLFTGGAKLASGILFNAAGYPQLYNNSKTQTASRVTNHLLFAASVVGVPATSFAMADTLRIQVTGELNRRKLAAKGELPGQLIKKRLAQLDQLEARLKAQ